jgi:hypothetical protein
MPDIQIWGFALMIFSEMMMVLFFLDSQPLDLGWMDRFY